MNTCGTCQYFGRDEDEEDEDDAPGYAIAPYKVCGYIEHRRPNGPAKPAYVIDASDYHATLCVKEDFGCALWKARK